MCIHADISYSYIFWRKYFQNYNIDPLLYCTGNGQQPDGRGGRDEAGRQARLRPRARRRRRQEDLPRLRLQRRRRRPAPQHNGLLHGLVTAAQNAAG
jgi:hypothetical protein